jgi:hypothetical protein
MSIAGQFGVQAIGIAVTAVWSAVCPYLIVKLLDHTVGARVSLERSARASNSPSPPSDGRRNEFAPDSALEEAGFEISVPRDTAEV